MPPGKPAYKKAKWDQIETRLKDIDPDSDDIWGAVRGIVNDIPRKGTGCRSCPWWDPNLERMRDDTRRLRRIATRDPLRREDYLLVRKIYRAAIVQTRFDHLKNTLATAKDPDIFRYVHALENPRTLPSMDSGDSTLKCTHAEISDLIAAQLDPIPPTQWKDGDSDLYDTISPHLEQAIKMSPSNTATSHDDMSYPFIRFWFRKARASLEACLRQAVRFGIEDWHRSEVVLIRKANKPRYDVVKGWRMIHLLPVLGKVVDRMVLLGITDHVDLEDTQFGSRRRRGTHDALAVIMEFLKEHRGWHTALLSMDVEGGFDKIRLDMLADLLVARGCPNTYVSWIRHWASQRQVRFRFNERISKSYCLSKGIPQGSPLSPFLFGVYVADIFRPRLR